VDTFDSSQVYSCGARQLKQDSCVVAYLYRTPGSAVREECSSLAVLKTRISSQPLLDGGSPGSLAIGDLHELFRTNLGKSGVVRAARQGAANGRRRPQSAPRSLGRRPTTGFLRPSPRPGTLPGGDNARGRSVAGMVDS
jgi:hypothetical protein